MIKEALQYIVGLGNTRIEKDGERLFSTQPLHAIDAAIPDAINVRSLSGLVEYLKSHFDGTLNLMVHVVSPTEVNAFTTFNRDYDRGTLIVAKAMLPSISFGSFSDVESFNILLQSCFVRNEDRDIMLQVVGNIKEEAVNNIGDDGVSQSVVAKTGVATVAPVKVPNPVYLKPYRTFVGVEQPESAFVFRMQSGPKCALFEADGGSWKLEAMQRVKGYLIDSLEDEIKAGNVVIIA
jgi:hypothetical protein